MLPSTHRGCNATVIARLPPETVVRDGVFEHLLERQTSTRSVKSLPDPSESAEDPELKRALQAHLEEPEGLISWTNSLGRNDVAQRRHWTKGTAVAERKVRVRAAAVG